MDGAFGFVHNAENQHSDAKFVGMGAILDDNGCGLRLWAPHADDVKVRVTAKAGEQPLVGQLTREDQGFWAGHVEAVHAGHSYKFLIQSGDETFERIDPYAREVTNSVGEGVIVDPQAFDWQGIQFELPPHNELVIYEMHVGSFMSREGETGKFETALQQLIPPYATLIYTRPF